MKTDTPILIASYRFLIASVVILVTFPLDGSAQVQTDIESSKVYELSIIEVYPDSFPQVEVVFLARDEQGKPLWGISKGDLEVSENGDACDVISLTNISEADPINVALVIDHSSSMALPAFSMALPTLPDSMLNETFEWTDENITVMDSLPPAIDLAKKGVLSFIRSVDLQLDSILVCGFSSWSDSILGPTQDMDALEKEVLSMTPFGGTAYYDALCETMHSLDSPQDHKSAIVSLTDGDDNASINTVNDVISLSQSLEIPIYIIGLGNVQDTTLQRISEETHGLFYKTDDPSQLEEIYLNISRQLKSVYSLRYNSQIESFDQGEQQITFAFTNDSLSFSNPDLRLSLPEETRAYLEEQAERKLNQTILFGAGAATLVMLGTVGFMIYRRKRKGIAISKLYPNPFNSELNLEITGSDIESGVTVIIFDQSGKTVHTSETFQRTCQLQLSHLSTGTYIVNVALPNGTSVSKVVLKG